MKLISENKIDTLGRVTLPAQIRHKLGMDKGDSVDIFEDNGFMIIKKHNRSCIFCGHSKNLTEYNQQFICSNCLDNLKK